MFFASPVAWLFLATFTGATLFIVFWVESFFARNIADLRPLFRWMPVLLAFLCPALTMRMWSEERQRHTLEHVLTQPVGISRFVFGKFGACLLLLALALLATAPLPVTVSLIAELDWGPVAAGYLAALLLGSAYLSIGLFVSACTDNPIVSLIASVALCIALYLLGSPLLTGFFEAGTADWLRALGSGSRFESIARGVVDVRDLYYYLGLTGVFLTLNVYALERGRWSRAHSRRHRYWRSVAALLVVNFLLANVWLHKVPGLRLDVTEGRLYSLSDTTGQFLQRLEEPLLIRGYFSERTHPLLAPLVPQLRDLIEEYREASGGRVRVEFVDPADNPDLEREAIERYGLRAAPFQVSDRHQSAVVNAWFHLVVHYGDEFETLGFGELIEVRNAVNAQPEVRLRNPEYDLTRAIRDVLYSYRSGGQLFAGIDTPVELVAYVSDDVLLPPLLQTYRQSIASQLQAIAAESGGKFSYRFVAPEADGGLEARRIVDEWGFTPMATAIGEGREFFFYLTLEDDHQVVQLPNDSFDPGDFRRDLETGLRRFSSGFTRTVALAVPTPREQGYPFNGGAPTFSQLEQMITRDYSIRMEQLADGSVTPEADILVVVAPHQLDTHARYAIDQFLMRGGTVLLATSPWTVSLAGEDMRLLPWPSGLEEWLAHHGLHIGDELVMDDQNATFPAPVIRRVGDREFRELQLVDYPYFIDLRPPGLNPDHPITANLPRLTMGWASPVTVQRGENQRLTTLLRSSPAAWLSSAGDVTPRADSDGQATFYGQGERKPRTLGVILQGRFHSQFTDRPPPKPSEAGDASDPPAEELQPLVELSPLSARIILFSSNDFLDDQTLNAAAGVSGTRQQEGLELLMNAIDWSLRDSSLLRIRSRGHFNRTLPPMSNQAQTLIEYFNYALALAWLALLALVHWLRARLRMRHYRKTLAL
nr:Gldg family protein [Parahaliea mediterranea]